MEPLPRDFVVLRQSKLNLHRLYNPELALQDDTIFAGNDVIRRQMTSYDPPSWMSPFHLEKPKNNVNVCNCIKKLKKYRNMSKKFYFWQNLHDQ